MVEVIRRERVIAVLRERVEVAGLGTPVVEVTMHVEDAFGAIAALCGQSELTVLAGTVRSSSGSNRAFDHFVQRRRMRCHRPQGSSGNHWSA